jgi:hypothetical protein
MTSKAIAWVVVGCVFAVFMCPVLNYWGNWLMSRPSLCLEEVGHEGASNMGMAKECKTRGAKMTIEHVNATMVVVCRCSP